MSTVVSLKRVEERLEHHTDIPAKSSYQRSGMQAFSNEDHPENTTLKARQGRDNQRYGPDGARLCAGCIPIRFKENSGDGIEGVEVLMVSSRGGKGLGLPKGGWEADETAEEAARRETVEEAGVKGCLEEPAFGVFNFKSSKLGSHQGKCAAHLFVMHVTEVLEVWPEAAERQRIWCSVMEAGRQARHHWMREALEAWIRQNRWTCPFSDSKSEPSPSLTGGSDDLESGTFEFQGAGESAMSAPEQS